MALIGIGLIICHSAPAGQSSDSVAVVQAVAPFYPPLALAAHISGEVIVEVEVNNNGDVVGVKALEGHKLLQPAAEMVARRWLFKAVDNNKGDRQVKLRFRFTLLKEEYSREDLLPVFRPPFEVEIKDTPDRIEVMKNSDPPMGPKVKRKKPR
jgi:TonB family protein